MPVQIPVSQLVKYKCYVGRGRNGNVGLWDGQCFQVIAEKFDEHTIKHEPYYTDDCGCFQPFAVVDEVVMAEPFGKVGWDRHYGRRVEFLGEDDAGKITGHFDSDLMGCWMGSGYRWDGGRIDYMLLLNADGTFERSLRDHREQKTLDHIDRGTWLHDRDENLLHFKSEDPDPERQASTWCILGFTGSTLLLRWLVLASRNLPIQFYRVDLVRNGG